MRSGCSPATLRSSRRTFSVEMMHSNSRQEDIRKIAPLFIAGGLCLFSAPIFHPNNTCADWLEKWGQLSANRFWIPIHQVASLGFALGAGAVLLLAIVGPRRSAGLCAGATASVGLLMMSLMALIHATSVSVVGAAYNAATNDQQRNGLRLIANAFVSYDVAVDGVAAVLISGGLIVLAWHLHSIGLMSWLPALVLAGDGSIWAVQYFHLLHVVHYSFPEWVPYTSLGLWLCAVGVLVILPRRLPAVSTEAAATA
jgi:hypothetical protein